MTSSNNTTMDEAFHRRIQGAIQTVQAWDDDPLLLAECRAILPWEKLRRDDESGDYAQPEKDDKTMLSRDARFVQRLTRFFKSDMMTWLNNPDCAKCHGKNTVHKETRGPLTMEEREGQASRVEVYTCNDCGGDGTTETETTTTTFARYNSPRKLLETRRGRCGEYANLFGLFCRAVGLETRYILDLTDHVWTEVLLTDCQQHEYWMMCDSCEAVVDEPSMYEAGWGKKLNYVVAVAADHVVDVTPRYTRQFYSAAMQARRRTHTSSEAAGDAVVQRAHALQCQSLSNKKAKASLDFRLQREAKELERLKKVTVWENGTVYGQGRISGSLAWKLSRQEAGKTSGVPVDKNDDASSKTSPKQEESSPTGFHVESFYPMAIMTSADSKQVVSIAVVAQPKSRHGGIVVSGTPCAVGQDNTIDVVVVDEKHVTCILQSRSFHSLQALALFIETLPALRIVAIRGRLPLDAESSPPPTNNQVATKLSALLGEKFDASFAKEGILYIGQVRAQPDWAFCSTYVASPDGYMIQGEVECNNPDLGLKTERNAYPSAVTSRLSEACMPLQTQLLATHEQKRIAFLSFIQDNPSYNVSGYTTRPGAPVYLLGETAFPFERTVSEQGDDDNESWHCFLRLPAALVPEGDVGVLTKQDNIKTTPGVATFEVPLDLNFFFNQIGFALLQKENGMSTRRDTGSVLRNSRLVGLYFSAHWCGPCRSFTPMLAEMYVTLKEEYPTHGLEIIFVSSDRDPASFENYYRSMPWTAIPFDALGRFKQQLSMIYGVRGIPNFVILDAVSGQVVVPGDASRREVMQACQRGDEAIKAMFQDWLARVPAETTELVSMLEASCNEHHVPNESEDTSTSPPLPAYLVKKDGDSNVFADTSPLNGKFHAVAVPSSEAAWETECTNRVLEEGTREQMKNLLATTLKYVENAQMAPWNPKYRTFKLGNKVADAITRVPHGVQFLHCLGFELTATPHDFTAIIPLETDLDVMQKSISAKLEEYSNSVEWGVD